MIKITNLNKYFYRKKSNEIHVINDVTFEFPKTGLVTIFGESGCGKTTLMNVLGGLDDFYSGSIEIDDFKINKYNSKIIDRVRNEKIGYIFQNYLLLPQRTVYDNLIILLNMYDISLEEKNERIDYVLEAVGMLKYKKKNISELSGGQQQRVAIARALIKSPSLILADEPTGNLDEKNTIQIMNIIKKISENTLVILVSHEKSIATSYSDYIIDIVDGRISNQVKSDGNVLYHYEDDQNIYLKEYEYKNLSNENVNIDFYSNDNNKINLQIVFKNNKFYIKSDTDTIFIDDSSEIKLLDEHKKVLDATEEIKDSNFELKKLEFVKTPSLSFKEQINLAVSNLNKMKKRTLVLAIPMFILVIMVLLCLQSMVSASYFDRRGILKIDSRIETIILDKVTQEMETEAHTFGYKVFYKGLLENNPDIEPVLSNEAEFNFTLPTYSQISSKKYSITGFSLLTTDCISENQLIYGRMPNNINEIVIEKWVLEETIKESTLSNFMNVSSFLNLEVQFKNVFSKYKIVGIVDNNQNSAYVNKWVALNLFPSYLKNDNYKLIPLSEYNKLMNTDLSFNEREIIIDSNVWYDPISPTLQMNDDKDVELIVISKMNLLLNNYYNIIVHDDIYDEILMSVASSSFDKLDLFTENEFEKKQIRDYVESVKDYFMSGELKATEEFGFDTFVDYEIIRINLKTKCIYDELAAPYLEQIEKDVASRLLITLTIILISVIIVFFSMKSYSIKNIYDIGVYRAIGIKKGSIVFVYALEILIISLKTTLVGGVLTAIITNILEGIPMIALDVAISYGLAFVATMGLILINILVGVLPIIGYLKLTPSQILSKYDI